METTASTAVYERELTIAASPETVWRLLVDPEQIGRWLGSPVAGHDARPGGTYRVEIAKGHVAAGAFVEWDEPRRLVHTWGWEQEGDTPSVVPPGASTVEIDLVPVDGGTLLRFVHRGLPTAEAVASHRVGWEHYLGRFDVLAGGGDPGPDPWLEGAT